MPIERQYLGVDRQHGHRDGLERGQECGAAEQRRRDVQRRDGRGHRDDADRRLLHDGVQVVEPVDRRLERADTSGRMAPATISPIVAYTACTDLWSCVKVPDVVPANASATLKSAFNNRVASAARLDGVLDVLQRAEHPGETLRVPGLRERGRESDGSLGGVVGGGFETDRPLSGQFRFLAGQSYAPRPASAGSRSEP